VSIPRVGLLAALLALPFVLVTQAAAATVVDAAGLTLTLAGPPERIVIAGRGSHMIVNAIYLFPGAHSRVAGMAWTRQLDPAFSRLVDPSYDSRAILEGEVGPEQIAPLRPDLVMIRRDLAPTLGAALTRIGIPVLHLDLETPEQFERDLAILGAVLGQSERAAELAGYYRATRDRVAAANPAASPRVLVVWFDPRAQASAVRVPPAAWIQTRLVELAGGHPVWLGAAPGGNWQVVSAEQVAAWDPDLILVIDYAGDPAEAARVLSAATPWRSLRAVRESRIAAFPADAYAWDQPDPRWALGLLWTARMVNPAAFTSLDLEAEARAFFELAYGLNRESFERHIAPRLQGDYR
jgi:iron complex transport system substrate-binding protein